MGLKNAVTIAVPIYIPHHSKENLRWLHKCVESCAKQIVPFPFHVELWDDGSGDTRVSQTIKVLARRFHCDAFECTRTDHNTAGWIMNQILDHCETEYIFWIGCDDEIHPLYIHSCLAAWASVTDGEKIIGTATDCMKEVTLDGRTIHQKFSAASSPLYKTELIRENRFDERIPHGIDGKFQRYFINEGYTFKKVQEPLYLYRFHEKQLSKDIHYEKDEASVQGNNAFWRIRDDWERRNK